MKSENTFSKKMHFAKEPKQEILSHIQYQIQEKKDRELNEKVDSIVNDRKDLTDMKHKVLNDISWKQNEKLEAKMLFM